MKAIPFALFVGLLLVGCEQSSTHSDPVDSPKAIDLDDPTIDLDEPETRDKIIAEAIDVNTLQKRGKKGEELYYAPNQQTPHTGWVKEMYDNGQIARLAQYKDGKQDGLTMGWFENGQKWYEENFKDDMWHGLQTMWYENGQKKKEGNYKEGKEDGLHTSWYENGQKTEEENYKDGKWHGLQIGWYEDGTEAGRRTFKNGEPVD